MWKLLSSLFPSKHEKDVKELLPLVAEINTFYNTYQTLSDDELRGKTNEFKDRIESETGKIKEQISTHEEKLRTDLTPEEHERVHAELSSLNDELDESIEEVLDKILPEAFAVVKETCRRLVGKTWTVVGNKYQWDMIPFDVQLMGGIVLHQGKISEMATGEGKTLVATLPMYLNALPGRGVHLVTVNDYLARRDAEWMGPIFEFHGLTVGVIQNNMTPQERYKQYRYDITYGTNNEFGFDYLRDNMVIRMEDMVHRGYNYAIVDEVDSVLIDEARTPLIISGPVNRDDHQYNQIKPTVEQLVRAQRNFVNKIVGEAETFLANNDEQQAGILLLRAYRGLPKHPKLSKLLSEPSNKRIMQQVETDYLRDQQKRMHEIDDELYYAIDEKNHTIDLTDKGREMLSGFGGGDKEMFVLPDIGTAVSEMEHDESVSPEEKQKRIDDLSRLYSERSDRLHTIHQLLRAYSLYEHDVEYVVQDGKVLIVDTFTGRLMPGRRYSDGLHQAIEAKEGVTVERDTQTLATITLQNYFRLYKKLAGMTGTAETEAQEFGDIYKLDVVVIPTNKPMVRADHEDQIYRTIREKYNAAISEIEEMRRVRRPILVGTTSVEVSETISRMLKRKGIQHNVLNAKQHQREAEIVANAGLPGTVTIATNMAGRGTDIKLGPGVKEAGGLHIIGTERHEARRIDRQLRGRAGRQGDPGSSRFYLSLEDNLMRLFGSERIAAIMQRMGLQEGEVIQHRMITKSVERAQKKVEQNNFAIRKRLLEYDNVMNQQREIIYSRRKQAISGERLKNQIFEMVAEWAEGVAQKYYADAERDLLREHTRRTLLVDVNIPPEQWESLGEDGLAQEIVRLAEEFYQRKEEKLGTELMADLERIGTLQIIDTRWKDHLREMDDMKEGIHLRAYGQKDPLLEYKSEAFRMFSEMLGLITEETLALVFKAFPQTPAQIPVRRGGKPVREQELQAVHQSGVGLGFKDSRGPVGTAGKPAAYSGPDTGRKPQPVQVNAKVGRNEPCPCGSGKKYKQCHGR
jgi:preprotein translocase subunit SecA